MYPSSRVIYAVTHGSSRNAWILIPRAPQSQRPSANWRLRNGTAFDSLSITAPLTGKRQYKVFKTNIYIIIPSSSNTQKKLIVARKS
ncbi:predicted protein [Sclerotinia sclerotiorum 1980 UF-70]|uniref:Uncharacterized protein n=1 Tax=Sclerotinia sclerotiorum (strain ATCC 18683 / 1980 / Ss-1) TaxID=665079 RepID=A7E7P6_SCLS1|nr:predicted protein [Sclerotinia sclerotiorum 1980 UF-70]EDN96398.1 predicted protein [Sclerotinia sclerotiorum 1980 UF-70]